MARVWASRPPKKIQRFGIFRRRLPQLLFRIGVIMQTDQSFCLVPDVHPLARARAPAFLRKKIPRLRRKCSVLVAGLGPSGKFACAGLTAPIILAKASCASIGTVKPRQSDTEHREDSRIARLHRIAASGLFRAPAHTRRARAGRWPTARGPGDWTGPLRAFSKIGKAAAMLLLSNIGPSPRFVARNLSAGRDP